MNEMTRQQLEQAYEAIEADDFENAMRILNDVVAREPDNADAWWLMANAVAEPTDARRALINVLKHDPSHTRAQETLDMLNDQIPPTDEELKLLSELQDITRDVDLSAFEAPLSDDELFDLFDESSEIDTSAFDSDDATLVNEADDDPFAALLDDDEQPKAENKGRRQREKKAARSGGGGRRLLLLLLLVLLIGGAAAVIITGGSDDSTEGDAGQADLAALTVADTADDNLVEVAGRVREDAARVIGTQTSAFVVTDGDQTALYVQSCVCVSPECQGPPASQLATIVEESFLTVAERIEGENIEGVTLAGVNITSCTGNDTVYRATVAITDAIRFLESGDLAEFRGNWNVVQN